MIYGNILVPIDGSKTAALGLDDAIRLARDQGARVRLLHVVNEQVPISANAYGPDIGLAIETLILADESLLGAAEAAVRRVGVEVETMFVEVTGGRAGAHVVADGKPDRRSLPRLAAASGWQRDHLCAARPGRDAVTLNDSLRAAQPPDKEPSANAAPKIDT